MSDIDLLATPLAALALGLTALIGIVILILLVRSRSAPGPDFGPVEARIAEITQLHGELAGRLAQLTEQTQQGQAVVNRTLEERLAAVGQSLTDSLDQSSRRTGEALTQLQTRLAVIDQAQRNLTDLAGQMSGLQQILSNKQARGAFGEVQLQDLVTNVLPPNAYAFQVTLGNGRRADCLLTLPNPPGAIAIDAKFPLESYHLLRQAEGEQAATAARRAFGTAVAKHVRDIAERYIVPGETADSALMFLPSEAVYAELHAALPEVVERAFRTRVWIVSPTTLMATLNTVRAVLKDAKIKEQAHLIQAEVRELVADVDRLEERIGKLARHFGQAQEDIRQAQISTEKIKKRGDRIEALEVDGPTAPLPGAE